MNRQKFCELMAGAKESSGVTTSQISFEMKMLLPTLRRFEKGEHNFNMKKTVEYLHTIKSQIVISNTDKCFYVKTYDDMVDCLIKLRTNRFSQRQLAEQIGSAYLTIANIERKATVMSIDTFLKIAEALEVDIKIDKI